MKRFFGLAAAALAALMLLAAVGCGGMNGADDKARKYEHSIGYYYTPADTATRFFADSALLESSMGGEVDAFLTSDGSSAIARVGTGLYRIDGEGILMVHPAGVDRALISLDGSKTVYTTATEVHIYDHVTGNVENIKPEVSGSVLSIVISPDGNTVGYTVKSDGVMYSFAHSEGASRKLSNNAYIIGVGDGAEYWYYLTPEADLYYAKQGSQKKLGSECANLIEFNRDLTEVLFDMNGVTYFSRNGGSAKRILAGASMLATAGECYVTQGGEDCTAYVRDCATLFNAVFYDYKTATGGENTRVVYDVWYVDAGGRATALAKNAYQFSIAKGGDRLTCLVDSSLYCMEAKDPGTAELIANNVYSYIAATDLSVIYCVGYNAAFYRIIDLGSAEQLLENASYCVLTDKGECLCIADFDTVGDLYLIGKTGEPQKTASGVYMTETRPGFCCYYSAPYEDAEGRTIYDLYVSPDGHGFTLALQGVKLASE